MDIKDIRLKKGMSKEEVNELISEWLLLEDDIYSGDKHKHNWKCKCGNIIEGRIWSNIRRTKSIKCKLCIYNKTENKYKNFVNSIPGYSYIRSYRSGDILPNGKIVGDNPFMKIKHDLCGRVYVVGVLNFINNGNRCIKCCDEYKDTIEYYLIKELGLNIDDVIDFKKNKTDLSTTSRKSHKYIWMKCRNKDYHDSYKIRCYSVSEKGGFGCPSCSPKSEKSVHIYDSFGYNYFDKAQSWSPNNSISPFKVSPKSGKIFKFICIECGAEFDRIVHNVSNRNVICLECNMSEGERLVKEFLINKNIKYIPQHEYQNLIGVNGGRLSYDFYLTEYNILIEFQGDQHKKYSPGFHDDYGDFEKQLEHDNRKSEYAKINNIKLIKIWEEDKNNIEEILNKELISSNKLI